MKRLYFLIAILLISIAGKSIAQNAPSHGWHTYCDSEFSNAISCGDPTTIAICYPPDIASSFAGTEITKVGIFSDDLYNAVGGLYSCSIYIGGETPTEGAIIYTMTVDVPQGLGEWAEFDLSTPILVTGNETIWIVWQTEQPLTLYPMGVCSGSDPSGNGNWVWSGIEWIHLDDLSNGDWTVKTYFNCDEPQAQSEDVYYAGIGNNMGKIWKNNDLLYSISDSIEIQLKDLQVADDGTVYTAGYAFDNLHGYVFGRIWENDSCLFLSDTNTILTNMLLSGDGWVAAGENKVWQNGEVLFEYSHGEESCRIQSITINTTNNDFYAGGVIETLEGNTYACVWKNDSLLWVEEQGSSVEDLCFDGENIFAVGFMNNNDTIYGIVWQNDSVVVQIESASFYKVASFDSSLYWVGSVSDTIYVFQDGIPIYSLTEASDITAFIVNEAGIYCSTTINNDPLIWKNGVILYQPEECDHINALYVRPTQPLSYFTLTVEADTTGWGTVLGDGIYYYGDTAIIEAIPNPGCEFLHWNDSVTDNPRYIIITQDSTFIAYFIQIEYTIATEVLPLNSGTVTGSGIYHYGDTITLEAIASSGFIFECWNDSITQNPRTIVVENDTSFTAVFKPLQYEITTVCDPVEGGTVIGGGTYDYGSTVILTATPNENYIFLCWSDGIATNPRGITVTGNANYKALFHFSGVPQYTITVLANDPLLGTVTGSGTYPEGTTIEISAMPNAAAHFSGWDDGNTDNPRSIVVTQNMVFKAIFVEIETCTITVKSANLLQGTTYGTGIYPVNQSITIGATPSPGFNFSGWQDGDISNPRTIIVTGDAEYIASFSQIPVQTYTVDVLYDDSQGFILGAGTYISGTTASIAAIPADGFVFKKWNDGTIDNPKEVLVDHDIVLAAFFESTGILENETETIRLYPNPANNKIHISSLEGEYEAQIYNAFGTLVMTTTVNGEDEINIEGLVSGLYIICVKGLTLKFMKE